MNAEQALEILKNVKRSDEGKILPGQGYLYAMKVLLTFIYECSNEQAESNSDPDYRGEINVFVKHLFGL